MLQTAVLLLALVVTDQAAPSPLKIVVIEGEAGVNIIQQKTAVKPLIEVRDRNNQPVAGVIVTFSVEGGKAASFAGASTMTVATNAAGQAAVTSLTPNVAGAFQIQVSAAFQGQVATATIAQTNVVTAAQAAAASAATGSGATGSAGGGGGAGGATGGAAGGAGGGLSATTIAVAGAAVAGGAVAAVEVAQKGGGGETIFKGNFSGTVSGVMVSRGGLDTCTFSYAVSADARLKFDEFTDSKVNGKFDYSGSQSLTSSTCNPAPQIPTFIGEANPLTGSPSSFSGKTTVQAPTNGNITGSGDYTFQGSANGNAASGTFTWESRSFSPGDGGGSVTITFSGTFPINFTKQ